VKLNLEMLRIGRNRFIEELKNMGVMTSVHFIPLYKHPYYKTTFNYDPAEFTVSDSIYERIISLPIYPGMSNDDVAQVISSVEDVLRKFRS
jgi:dTDP-4-amino-4,6-dideoxygalactose transaminase